MPVIYTEPPCHSLHKLEIVINIYMNMKCKEKGVKKSFKLTVKKQFL